MSLSFGWYFTFHFQLASFRMPWVHAPPLPLEHPWYPGFNTPFPWEPSGWRPWQACPGRLPPYETVSKFYSNLNWASGTISSCGGTACCSSEFWQAGRMLFRNISFGDQVAEPEHVFRDCQSPPRLSKKLTLGKRRGQSRRALTYSVICVFSLINAAFIMLAPFT